MKEQYEIEDMVVQDESGVTFRARDRETDRIVSVRRFFPSEAPGSGFEGDEKAAFAGTVEALKQLRHPSLCGVLDGGVDEVDGIPYLVMEWAEGERLSEMLEKGSLAPEQAVAVGGQCLEVLDVLKQIFGDGAEWLEMEPVSVLVNAETGVCSFMICPLQVLGMASRDGGVKGLGYLIDLAMGWNGQLVPPAAAAGLGGWVRHAKNGDWSVAEAFAELVKIRSVWTGEAVPEEAAAPQIQLSGSAGAAVGAAEAAPQPAGVMNVSRPSLSAPPKGKAGMVAGMLFFGVLLLGGGVWLGMAQPWKKREVAMNAAKERAMEAVAEQKPLQTAPRVVVVDPPTPDAEEPKVAGAPTVEKPAVEKLAGGKETAQERIDRIAKETTERMGIDPEKAKEDEVMPAVFGPDDGAEIRRWLGANVVLEGTLFQVRDSKSGKTRYLEFSDEIGQDVLGVRCWPNEDFELEGLKALVGKKLRFKGRVEEERGTGRILVHLESRGQIEEL